MYMNETNQKYMKGLLEALNESQAGKFCKMEDDEVTGGDVSSSFKPTTASTFSGVVEETKTYENDQQPSHISDANISKCHVIRSPINEGSFKIRKSSKMLLDGEDL